MATTAAFLNGIDSPSPPGVAAADGLSSTKRTTNALSTKLTSVLSSSYADYEIRDALRLLDARGVRNDEDTRRDLKANAQREVIDCNAMIVDDFGKVAEQLKRVGAMITTLSQTCASMRAHIIAAKQESAPVLDEASTLISRKKETESKQALLDAFTTHFLVSTADLNILTSSAEPLDDRFFAVLARVQQIHRDCEVLLGYGDGHDTAGETQSPRLGLELMEQTTRNLDAGFKKLYNWIQREFKGLDLEDPHISGSIRRALRVLSERPTLFQNCLDFFAEARQTTLAEAFHDALMGSGSGGATKAIEFSTHEPLRYIGDMLAWVHSTAVSEKEALEGLFVSDADEISRGLSTGKTSEPWARIKRRQISISLSDDEDGTTEKHMFDGRKALSDLISRNLATVCSTLQSRVDVSVRSSGDPVLQFKTFNLLDFYSGIFAKLLGPQAALVRLVAAMQAGTLAHFEAAMADEVAHATSSSTATTDGSAGRAADLAPPPFLATALRQFAEVVRTRGPQMTEPELERLFTTMLSGIINASAEAAGSIADPTRRTIYKTNYMTALRATLVGLVSQVPATSIPLEKAGAEIQTLRDALVAQVLDAMFLDDSGVRELMQELDTRRGHGAKARHAWLVQHLDEFAGRLDEFLSAALMDAQEALKALLDKPLAKDVVAEAVERFCVEFDELEALLEMVDDKAENSADDNDAAVASIRDLYPRTGAEVRALLS
ncbi:uncharacterized protein A1O9_00839 [Exophiala aquamarina CBS 119918]|uniref:Conserved oligomeric Golgi complex subunit 6 n=1 Tax=Exophiala aquamarina CBS 119918 TaxID=1182545 RepID=A0A072PSM7_9EURO|nr:uncharacterized protein A1O9_00839 [Exophiala aquamarina CBS 119918]KEF62866.1 hypothetical protein A1O9_00839 [Exophiala aquamarina CBS 119918]